MRGCTSRHAGSWPAEGRYAACEVCGTAIPQERLEARPSSTRCVQQHG